MEEKVYECMMAFSAGATSLSFFLYHTGQRCALKACR